MTTNTHLVRTQNSPMPEMTALAATSAFLEAAPEQVLTFGHYVWLMRRKWKQIVLFVLTSTALAGVCAYRLTPQYESVAQLVIDLKAPVSVIGETGSGTSSNDADGYFNTELQIIQSDSVLRPVAEEFRLLPSKFQRGRYPGMLAADAPVALRNLTVTHPGNSYLINIKYRSPNPVQGAQIVNAIAHSYIRHSLENRANASLENSAFMEKQMSELKLNMENSAAALAGYERQMGVVSPEDKTSMLEARLLQLNTQYTDAQNDRIRKDVDYRAFQSGSLAAIEVSPQATALARMEESVHAAQEKMASVETIYGQSYPEYKRAANQLNEVTRQYKAMQAEIGKRIEVEHDEATNRESMLHSALLETKAQADALNAHSMQYQELKREAEANKSLYNELFRKVKEAGINGAFLGSAIRITDPARPQLQAVFPSKSIFLAMGFLLSLMAAGVWVILADMLDTTLRDPEQARRALGVEVLGILPHVPRFELLNATHAHAAKAVAQPATESKKWFETPDFYEESVHSLLSNVLVGGRGSGLRSLLVTSALPGEGKSSCVARLAVAHARQGYRTLLIDADLRRPFQHKYFDLKANVGLSNAIYERRSLKEVRQRVDSVEHLDVVGAGSTEGGRLDRVGRRVEELLAEAKGEYDMVFLDAPPMLCFAESMQIAGVVDGVLVVSFAGMTSRMAVAGVFLLLRGLKARTLGVVLNHVNRNMSASYKPYQAYMSHYRKPSPLNISV